MTNVTDRQHVCSILPDPPQEITHFAERVELKTEGTESEGRFGECGVVVVGVTCSQQEQLFPH
jgi:hypothetical protein